MTPEVPPGLEICHSLYISIYLLEKVSTSTSAPARTGATLPRSLPCTWSFTPKTLPSSNWFCLAFSILQCPQSKILKVCIIHGCLWMVGQFTFPKDSWMVLLLGLRGNILSLKDSWQRGIEVFKLLVISPWARILGCFLWIRRQPSYPSWPQPLSFFLAWQTFWVT